MTADNRAAAEQQTRRIHYFYDPVCGWCYGATALIDKLHQRAQQQGWQLLLHPGGMIPRRAIDSSFRQHILHADQRIGALTGMPFGQPYQQRVASNDALVLDSMLPTQAILTAKTLGLDDVRMLKAIQQAHYQHGLDISKEETLQDIALQQAQSAAISLTPTRWQAALASHDGLLQQTLQDSHQWMGQLGVQGFPTLLLETEQGWQRLDHSRYYGDPKGWQEVLTTLIK
ncbi:DsbA family protein [Oceanobacter kriegii]|uniref:DsbA family protein n=1 Tax=Oceanobacter kriegii TaxID=64972 RepID=UPI00042225D2|nr:DsbA family protein [Oceanobacter kriegii]